MSKSHVEDIALDVDISSAEGISLNYVSRDRMTYLMGQNQAMLTQTQFADAKAGAMLAFVGLLAIRGPEAATDFRLETATLGQMMLMGLHCAALVCCLIVLLPRYANRRARGEMAVEENFSWPALVGRGPGATDYSAYMRTSEISHLIISAARSNEAMAHILHRKFAWLRAGFVFACADILLVTVRLVTDF